MTDYLIEYRSRDSGQPMTCILTCDNPTLVDYVQACRKLVEEGHGSVRLYARPTSRRLVKAFGEEDE